MQINHMIGASHSWWILNFPKNSIFFFSHISSEKHSIRCSVLVGLLRFVNSHKKRSYHMSALF